jgi:signal transduction histidine kinase
MVSENAPVLFSARFPEVRQRPQQNHAVGTKSIAAQLVQTIAATLNAPDALPQLTEVLGTQLAAQACLILRFHRTSQDFYYTFWQSGEPVQFWMLSAKSAPPQAELQCRVARSLITHGTTPSEEPDSLPWREGIATLLQNSGQSHTWLQHVETCHTLSIHAAPDIDGIVLLLHCSPQPAARLDKPQEIEVAGLLAIALHQHHLQHQAQRSNEQLAYLNYLKEDFLSTLNHELRTPLTSMMLAIRMLRRPDLTPERAAMYFDILEQQCSREINLVNDLLLLQSVDGQQSQAALEATDLVSTLSTLAEREQGHFTRAQLQLKLDLPDSPVIMSTSGDHLNRVVQELLTNARKYAAPRSTITLSLVDHLTTGQTVQIKVSNVGAGIQPEELPHVFEKFRRGQNATRNAIPGTGTGLALVKGLLEQLSSTISVISQPVHGRLWQTCFTIELPVHNGTAKYRCPVPE